MNPLSRVLAKLREARRPAFIPFVTAGDPGLAATGQVVDTLVAAGADVIEIGFPYSDPLADGPVIQASYTRALRAGCRLNQILDAARLWQQRHPSVPLVAMTAFSLVYRRGADAFITMLRQAGFSGLIIPDLPAEEAASVRPLADRQDLCLIQLVTPTTPPERVKLLADLSRGFLYVVSVVGLTGARSELPSELLDHLRHLRTVTDLPLCVGFGVSAPQQVRLLRPHVDGVIVGSALVQELGQDRPWSATLSALADRASQLRAALDS
jgi:tryptophan synthase alpha chain